LSGSTAAALLGDPKLSTLNCFTPLAPGNGTYDKEGFGTVRDHLGQQCVWRIVGNVFAASEEADERSPSLGTMVANRPSQHWIFRLEGIQDRALRRLAVQVELYLSIQTRKCAQMRRQHDSYHGSV
jgi:hypothetical protein